MSNWHNDSFFSDPFGDRNDDIFSSFDRHFEQMNQRMNSAFNAFFGSNHPLHSIEDYSDSNQRSSSKKSRSGKKKEPIVEEPDDDNFSGYSKSKPSSGSNSYFYSSTTTSFTGPDGIQKVQRKVHDSASGKTQLIEGRRIGDKSVTYQREIDSEGKTIDTETRHNITDDDVNVFTREWEKKNSKLPKMSSLFGPSSSNHKRMLH